MHTFFTNCVLLFKCKTNARQGMLRKDEDIFFSLLCGSKVQHHAESLEKKRNLFGRQERKMFYAKIFSDSRVTLFFLPQDVGWFPKGDWTFSGTISCFPALGSKVHLPQKIHPLMSDLLTLSPLVFFREWERAYADVTGWGVMIIFECPVGSSVV